MKHCWVFFLISAVLISHCCAGPANVTSEVNWWRSHDVEKTRNKRDGGATAIASIVIGAVFSAAGTAVSASGVPGPSNGAGPDGGCLWNVEAGCSKEIDWTCPPRHGYTLTHPFEFVKLRPVGNIVLDGWGNQVSPHWKSSSRVPSPWDPRTSAHCGSR